MSAPDPLSETLVPNTVTVRSFPAILGIGAGVALIQSVFDYTGGLFSSFNRDPNVDEYERKERLRRNRRRPIQETLDQVGEGRGGKPNHVSTWLILITCAGIYGPGYSERRRAKIKQNYGIDVPAN